MVTNLGEPVPKHVSRWHEKCEQQRVRTTGMLQRLRTVVQTDTRGARTVYSQTFDMRRLRTSPKLARFNWVTLKIS